ncbi:RICIN domain-containing protein [Bacillus mycoides]|uniref:RICIN domain-containing protein n=1 Tax=Bacillus TaxID=1386 RepID=UPI001914326E|nr:RICIN domain-containing protein [Bacillus sp. TH25]MBK5429721.1 RICIN domain-containing protein [Bacillus sp. TH25]
MDFKKDYVYSILNDKSQKYMDVDSNATDNGAWLDQYEWQNYNSQKWIIYPLDGGYYVLINRASGRMMDVVNNSKDNGAMLNQYEWQNSDSQQWNTEEKEEGYIAFQNKNSGKYADVDYNATDDGDHLNQYEWQNSDSQKWMPTEVEKFTTLPSVETQDLPPVPQYTSIDDLLPDTTDSVVTAYTLAPFFAVNDPQYNSETIGNQVNENPYYPYIKKQYWKLVKSLTLTPGETQEYDLTYGITTTDQQTASLTVSNTIGADAGLQFKDKSLGLSTQYTSELNITISQTNEEMAQAKNTYTINNPYDHEIAWSKYILVTEYHVERTNGTTINTPWSFADINTTRSVSYPPEDTNSLVLSETLVSSTEIVR